MKRMKHIYLCGPVTGRPLEKARQHFGSVEQNIHRTATDNNATICTSNPMRFCLPGIDWHQAMRTCVSELARCGGIALLQGWQQSKGAVIELKLAEDLHIPVVYIEPPAGPDYLTSIFAVAPETLRYYNARLLQFQREGVEESLAEDRAVAELTNRYLDPYGFEYINIEEGK